MNKATDLMEVKGVKAPVFNEPKGIKFETAMKEILSKVEKQVGRRNHSAQQIKDINSKINKIKADILMAEDEFEEMELRKRKKKLQEELENTEDFSGIDVKEYARRLFDKPEIKQLEEEARTEYSNIYRAAKEYEEELDKQYNRAKKKIQDFTADYRSVSKYKYGNVLKNYTEGRGQ